MGRQGSDWISRVTIPDMYPRKDDPFRPGASLPPSYVPEDSQGGESVAADGAVGPSYATLTSPGARPPVCQRAVNIQLAPGTTAAPIPIMNNRFECDTIVIDVPSTAANSVFFGYGSSITTASGLEVRPGLPVVIQPDNTREMWEIQRILEGLLALKAYEHGVPSLPPYRAPRVVFNAAEYFLIAAAATTVAVMLFYVPEQQ